MTGLFFLLFKPSDTPGEEKGKESKKASLSRKIIYILNNIADRAGRFIAGAGGKGRFTIKKRILEVLEYEKDIHITPAAFMGYKSIIALLLLAAGAFLGNTPLTRALFALTGAASGYFIPDIMVGRYSANVSDDIERELSYVIDLLRVSSLSGQNIYNSFKMLTEKYNGRICGDIKRFIRDIDLGAGKDHAYKNLIMASRSEQFREFINIIMEADKYGSPVNSILSRRSVQINQENWDNAERKAKRKGLLTLLPLVFLILPAFILLVGGPLIFSLASGLF